MPECVPAERTPLTLEFTHNLETTFCLADGCQFENWRVAAAPDGSAWVLGYIRQGDYQQKFTLTRFATDGTVLGNTEVVSTSDRYTALNAELTVDEGGQAHVAWYSVRAPDADAELEQRVQVETFDGDLQRDGDPLLFTGASETLVQAAGGKLALAGNKRVINRGGFVGVLDESRQLLWNQSQVNSGGNAGLTALAFAPDGSATVLMDRGGGGDVTTRFGLARFGSDGNALWDVNLTSAFASGYQGALARDSAGNVIVGLFLSPDAITSRSHALVENFNPDGQLRWAMRVDASGGGVAPVVLAEPGTNRVLVATNQGLLAVASDGASCSAYDMSMGSGRAMALGPQHDVYAIDQRSLVRYSGL
ncbi:MAG TPA: hypothetical protein VI072_21450 [Polyangiaceae bacterium]